MDFSSALENIYISPTELCNLNCRLCYTNKTKNILTNAQILSFIRRYRLQIDLKSVLFCGGEVFALKNFPRLINQLLSNHIFVSIITNGTIDRLLTIKDPKNCQLLVSFDGPKEVHDHNRGEGNFDKAVKFVSHALKLGFPVEIMYLVTPESYPYIDTFNLLDLPRHFITQKTYFYTTNHPLSNQNNTTPALTPSQIINLKTNYPSLPPKNFGCFQLSLQSDSQIYGCCESPYPLAKSSEKIPVIIKKFQESLVPCTKCGQCLGCCAPNFICGYKNELGVKSCHQIIKLFS